MSTTWRAGLGSIRNRIVVGYVALIAVALIITLLVARVALVSRLDHDIDTRLADEVAQLEVIIAEGNPDTGAGFADAASLFDIHLRRVLPDDDGAFYTLVDGDPYLLSFDAPLDLSADTDLVAEWAAVETSTFQTVDSAAGPVRLLIVPVELSNDSGMFVAATFTRDARADLDDVFRVLALVGALVLLASALIALTIAARVVRPIRELTAVTTSITEADLSARIPVEGSDEIAELSNTFNAMMARLDAGFAAQRSFLDDVAHELRTPITIIQGHLDVLGDDPVERAETTAVLTDELRRMNRYVDDLLVLAQAERPDFLRLADTDLDDLLDSIMAKVPGLGYREWVVESRVHSSAMLDEQRIVQAVLNLAQNAVRHSEDGSRIGIGIAELHHADASDGRDDRDGFRLWVADSGTGVDPAIVDALFERHIRSASSRSDGGIGLGLSIVDAIAVAHGGRVSVDSTAGEGATFTIEFPASVRPSSL
jgi:two-component system, OmpR family, sensor kinase